MLSKKINNNKNFKVAFIFGTRPEALKLISLIKIFQSSPGYKVIIILSGQHTNLVNDIIEEFKITEDYNLKIMKKNQSLEYSHSKILIDLSKIIKKEIPNMIITQGDTSTTLAGSFSSFYNNIPLVHIEAGLRTENLYSPYPEEMNRRVVSRLATYNFAATNQSRKNLIKEGILSKNIKVVGNTIIDTLRITLRIINKQNSKYSNYYKDNYKIQFKNKKSILVTCHRRENFKKGIYNICDALLKISKDLPNVQIIFVMHPNPNVKDALKKLKNVNNIFLIKPQKYICFIYLIKMVDLILTDSGGIQEESTYFNKPLLITRDNTERQEGIKYGQNKLIGTVSSKIVLNIKKILSQKKIIKKNLNPFGDGNSFKYIYKYINNVKKNSF